MLWETMRPDDTDVFRIRCWSRTPELLVGRVVYRDSRRGTPLTLEQVRKGFDDFFSGVTFSPEALAVYLLRWLENMWQFAVELGVDLDAEAEQGGPLASIAKYAWMLEGLPPDPTWLRRTDA